MIDELERIWRETIVFYVWIIYRHLLGRTEEHHERLQSG
jgi:hypothetical protein